MEEEALRHRIDQARKVMKAGKCKARCQTCLDAEAIVALDEKVLEYERAERRRRRAKAGQ